MTILEAEQVVRDVAKLHGLTLKQLRSRCNVAVIAAAKADACRSLRGHPNMSLPTIAKLVGYDNHTSVAHWLTGRGKTRHVVVAVEP